MAVPDPPLNEKGSSPTDSSEGLDTDGLVAALEELALDLHWSWNHRSDELWGLLKPELWATTHNPWAVLQAVSPETLEAFVQDSAVRQRIETLLDRRSAHLRSPAWFTRSDSATALTHVAYFSMEFALSEALPIYSGGLGNVAADQLKAACDLDVPVVGVGLLYQQGYFRQLIGPDGRQSALYPYNDPGQLPLRPVFDPSGQRLRIRISLQGFPLWLRVWQARVDRRVLYLLDSNDLANSPATRAITSELYGGGAELRLRQEIVLGIGGWRVLHALGIEAEVCHLNEGHAAFAVLERARIFAERFGKSFAVALAATRAGNVFTTHTAVPAGFDRFPSSLIELYLRQYAEDELGISVDDLLALGRINPEDDVEPFNMAYLAVRGSLAVNGVSRIHGAVSRGLFQPLFPRWPRDAVPIGHVTNGVHVPTWDSVAADELWTRMAGAGRWRSGAESAGLAVRRASDADLWRLRSTNRAQLVAYIRERQPRELAAAGMAPEEITAAATALDPDALTIVFARRFAVYKRPYLLLSDPDRLLRILSDPDQSAQLVLAGKAHPADEAGQALVADWVRFSRRPEAKGRVVFIPDYDLLLAEQLVQGADLWMNTPQPPWEASGTSGMKVLVNGGLNLSELDGWWAEAFTPDVGWALGDGTERGGDPGVDASESEALYCLLEREIIPAFYDRGDDGIPSRWVTMVRESMTTLTPRFSTTRVVHEYTERFYLPAAEAFLERSANAAALAEDLFAWHRTIMRYWPEVSFGEFQVETRDGRHHFAIDVNLAGLDPDFVRVELFANPSSTPESAIDPVVMAHGGAEASARQYTASVPDGRPASDFTPRVVPYHPAARIPLEASEILWLR